VRENKSRAAEALNKTFLEKKINFKVFILFEFLFDLTIHVKVALYLAIVVIKFKNML
jgi:hypothetical protein